MGRNTTDGLKKTAFKLGVVGHRDLGDDRAHSFSHFACHRILAASKRKYPRVQAISAISEGADSIFARSALSLGIPLESIIPFDGFASDFPEGLPSQTYERLRSRSVSETRTSFAGRSCFAYRRSMEWVVFKSDVVVAVWDEKEEGAIGGTSEAVALGIKIRKKIIHIDNQTKIINLYCDDGRKYKLNKGVHLEMAISKI